ncbi:hypothetical protein PISMIDRAFT_131179 [Pisolithus microcarpus 441]|uniref:Uncharacterized protein n=1 Tax=Pisolithus microcarpus 441 TaxID=765257 RepID=A0A0C9Z0T2_9AGAM|nr:hypothetical protein PISMIDRAFT_131179 [Pisolithus microcarpus 441]
MAQRRSPHRVSTSSPISSKVRSRKYSLRHLSAAKRALAFVNRIQHSSINSHASRASASSSDSALSIRPILATVQPNLRRLPSRQNVLYKNSMRDTSQNVYVSIGSKRKRVASASENTHAHGRPARGSGRHKRFKSNTPQNLESDDDDDDESGSMDVDSQLPWGDGVDSDADTDDAESCKLRVIARITSFIILQPMNTSSARLLPDNSYVYERMNSFVSTMQLGW